MDLSQVELVDVESSNVSKVGYVPAEDGAGSLVVRFRARGETPVAIVSYVYAGVPQDLFDRLLLAESKGSFLNEFVKGQFGFSRVEQKEE